MSINGPLMASCEMAHAIVDGRIKSSFPVEGWHSKCKGHQTRAIFETVTDDKGRKRRLRTGTTTEPCLCECHKDQPLPCLVCGHRGDELDERGQCVDWETCASYLQQVKESDPTWRKIKAADEFAAARRAEERALAGDRDEDERPVRSRRPRVERPTSGSCEHCGAPTKGGRFVAGHDAKLKGILKRAGAEGDVQAVAELIHRDWPTKGLPDDLVAKATDMVARGDCDNGWLAARIEERRQEVAVA